DHHHHQRDAEVQIFEVAETLRTLRPQGLFPVRQKLLAYGRQIYLAVRRPLRGEPVGANR
ncbi:hypothetical protein, partial [Nocardia cyriacigeorgica]